MALRRPPPGLDPATLRVPADAGVPTGIDWQSWRCTLVTPMYGGGVKAGEVDRDMPIRASALRGQLRFWWRLLARHKYGLGGPALREREFQVWGGVGAKAQASKVWVKVADVEGLVVEPWARYELNSRSGKFNTLPTPERWADVPYALFPAQGKRPGSPDATDPSSLARPGLHWTLHLGTALQPDAEAALREELLQRVPEALRWWASFGGVGARTRRGLGAVQVADIEPVGAGEAKQAGCTLVASAQAHRAPDEAWKAAVDKLRTFRQGLDIGRNRGNSGPTPGQSRWPEPDALRRLTGRHAPLHVPKEPAGNVFPRAAFGLPIVFHFKQGKVEEGKAGDPADFVLLPEGFDRLASPLVLRPWLGADQRWRAAALLLPHAHVDAMKLRLPGGSVAAPAQWWQPGLAAKVRPMAGHGTDALSAFLHFFAGGKESVA